MKRGMPAALYATLLAVLVSVAISVCTGALITLWLLHRGDTRWCPVLNQVTAVRPAAKATAAQRAFYGEMIALDRDFGCR